MRPVFVGNFGHDTRQRELERLFSKYGTVDRVDVKSGYAFVYYEDERDAEDAIHALDKFPFGYDRRKLSVEWARGERARDGPKGSSRRPTKTLFVINFDPIRTRVQDLERHFDPYGKLLSVRIRRNFAFVQFETLDDAIKALECTNMSKLLDRVITVEYAIRDDDERDDRDGSLGRGYGRSPYRRSPSPLYGRGRPSPDYGRSRPSPAYGHSRPSPAYGRPRSPVYGRPRSPAYGRPLSPAYGRPLSPAYGRPRSPAYGRPLSPAYGRPRSPIDQYDRRRSPVYDRVRSRSPIRRSRG